METVVYIEGDGIGPEVMAATRRVVDKVAGDWIAWVEAHAGLTCFEQTGDPLPPRTITLLRGHGVGIKAPTTTPGGGGFTSVNVRLRQELGLYAGIRPVESLGLPRTHDGVDLVMFRENTEGLYDCHEVQENGVVTLSARFTNAAMTRLSYSAFRYAQQKRLTRVTLITKQNIHKVWGHLYEEAFKSVAILFPTITADHVLVDAMGMRLAQGGHGFQVLVTENMFGDILSDVCAGLVGGLGVAAGANIGDRVALFEAVHGSAPDIAGKGIANPTALMFSSCLMLEHMGRSTWAQKLRNAIKRTLLEGDRTGDLGGTLNTEGFTQAVLSRL